MNEYWRPILGFEDRYEISSYGRVRSLPFMQRYLLRNGQEAYRKTAQRILATQVINSGYLVVHLHRENVRVTKLVHRLVAVNFVEGCDVGREVNHLDGDKLNNRADNLEWVSRSRNLRHAVETGLNPRAIAVQNPATGTTYPSITRAATENKCAPRTVRAKFKKVA